MGVIDKVVGVRDNASHIEQLRHRLNFETTERSR